MVTKFVARKRVGSNDLYPAVLQHGTESNASELDEPPELAQLYQHIKRDIGQHEILGVSIPAKTGPTAHRRSVETQRTRTYQPNPYVDYNGAGLLYFASYPTIADHLERLYVADHDLFDQPGDWALASSTIARDTFYFGNLDLGETLFGTVNYAQVHPNPEGKVCAFVHTSLFREKGEQLLAEVFSVKQLVGRPRS